jgi:hypothetical protein
MLISNFTWLLSFVVPTPYIRDVHFTSTFSMATNAAQSLKLFTAMLRGDVMPRGRRRHFFGATFCLGGS